MHVVDELEPKYRPQHAAPEDGLLVGVHKVVAISKQQADRPDCKKAVEKELEQRWAHLDRAKKGNLGNADDAYARIADPWAAGIGYQSDAFAATQAIEQLLNALCFIELMITQQRFGNSQMLEQLAGSAGILGGNEITFP